MPTTTRVSLTRDVRGAEPTRFAALGDSTTLGIGDPLPDGGWRGWAALLASAMSASGGVELHKLAANGARVSDVAGGQLDAALRLRPHLASVIVGANDTLRTTFDIAAIGAALTSCASALRGHGALVLTARLPEPGRMLRLPAALARPLARRIAAVNAISDGIARRYDTVHIDLASHAAAYDPRMWSIDRLHPSERGHRLLARCFAEALAARGLSVSALPGLEPGHSELSRAAEAYWMATQGTRWVVRRCGDLLPGLAGMAAAEWWYGVRGTASQFDESVGGEVAAVLARLEERVAVA